MVARSTTADVGHILGKYLLPLLLTYPAVPSPAITGRCLPPSFLVIDSSRIYGNAQQLFLFFLF